MDPRLKERLIGAVVLVALGVVFVPWLLDGPDPVPVRSSVSLELPLPDQAEPMRTQTIELDARRDTVARPLPADVPAVAAVPPERTTRPASPRPAPTVTEPKSEIGSTEQAVASPELGGTTVDGQWIVQLGSFSEEENARRLATRVASYGFDADVSTHRSSGRLMYRVRTQPVAARGHAEATASSLTAHGFVAQVMSTN